jgi:choice-of-anchor C domain-containing protein
MARRVSGWLVGVCAVGALVATGSAFGAAFTNGSFETGSPVPSGTFVTLTAVDTSVTGWTVSSGSIDYIDTGFWQAEDGVRSLDMSGNGPGRIEQTFDTEFGRRYTVQFYLGANTSCGSSTKGLDVGATGNPTFHYTFPIDSHTPTSMGWQLETYTFIATGASTTLFFLSTESSPCGPALDNVSVTAVPPIPALAPATAAVLALLLVTLGSIALARRTAG